MTQAPTISTEETVRSKTASEFVFEQLRRDIVTGHLQPGQRLVERELTDRYAVSRTPLREALKRLVTAGLAINIPYRGVVIRQLSYGFARDLYDLRLGVEGLASYLAALRATATELGDLRGLYDRINNASERGARDEVLVLNLEFHNTIARASHNTLLVDKVDELWASINLVRASAWQGTSRTQSSRREHKLILDAILARDPEAARHATEIHIRSSWQLVEAFLIAQTDMNGGPSAAGQEPA